MPCFLAGNYDVFACVGPTAANTNCKERRAEQCIEAVNPGGCEMKKSAAICLGEGTIPKLVGHVWFRHDFETIFPKLNS